jgi:hypothetical protein
LRCLRAAKLHARAAALAERHALAERATLRWVANAIDLLGARPEGALDEGDAAALLQAAQDALRGYGRHSRGRR